VDGSDFAILAGNFGKAVPAGAAPAPAPAAVRPAERASDPAGARPIREAAKPAPRGHARRLRAVLPGVGPGRRENRLPPAADSGRVS
jgi:hypothetical protein